MPSRLSGTGTTAPFVCKLFLNGCLIDLANVREAGSGRRLRNVGCINSKEHLSVTRQTVFDSVAALQFGEGREAGRYSRTETGPFSLYSGWSLLDPHLSDLIAFELWGTLCMAVCKVSSPFSADPWMGSISRTRW